MSTNPTVLSIFEQLKVKHEHLSRILSIFCNVYKIKGHGLNEEIYHASILADLKEENIPFQTEFPILQHYKKAFIGNGRADILINDEIIIEIKAVQKISPKHFKQIENYMLQSKKTIGVLINFPEHYDTKLCARILYSYDDNIHMNCIDLELNATPNQLRCKFQGTLVI